MPEEILSGISMFQLQVSGFDTIANLRTVPPAPSPDWTKRALVIVFGSVTAFDTAPTWYAWNPDDVTADNGSTVIKPTAIIGRGRWRLIVGGGGAGGSGQIKQTADADPNVAGVIPDDPTQPGIWYHTGVLGFSMMLWDVPSQMWI